MAGLFNSIFNIDITGDGKADFIDDSLILGMAEEEEYLSESEDEDDEFDELDEAIASGAIDEPLDL